MNTVANTNNKQKIKVLLEMRPAFEGFAGIPQEVRLLFKGLSSLSNLEIEGLLQTSHRTLAKGIKRNNIFKTEDNIGRKINRYSRVVISLTESPYSGNFFKNIVEFTEKKLISFLLLISIFFNIGKIRITKFESNFFKDFIWRSLFSKTLSANDFELVSDKNHRICSIPWHNMHMAGLLTMNIFNVPRYPKLDTEDFEIFIGQTPYPGRVNSNTKLVIRYHDAIPIFMPHTIPNKSIHQATHFYALANNVKNNSWFACVSESTRQELLKVYPELEKRSVTIHNMISNAYFNENADKNLIPEIIRSRLHEGDGAKGIDLNVKFLTLREKENFYKSNLDSIEYLLMVSTIEPRKNHSRLIAAWEVIRQKYHPNLKLIIVGGLGWNYESLMPTFKNWIDRGQLFMLSSVPSPELRRLYKNATATVCPSLGEGFDFSGVEAMRSGGVTVASDIPVHREVYQDAAEYFNPYSTMSLVESLKKVLYDKNSDQVRQTLVSKGEQVSAQYLPETILPQWDAFLNKLMNSKKA